MVFQLVVCLHAAVRLVYGSDGAQPAGSYGEVLRPEMEEPLSQLPVDDDVCDGESCDDAAVWMLQRRGKFVLDNPRSAEVHGAPAVAGVDASLTATHADTLVDRGTSSLSHWDVSAQSRNSSSPKSRGTETHMEEASVAAADIPLSSSLSLASATAGALESMAEISLDSIQKPTDNMRLMAGCQHRVAGPAAVVDVLGVISWRWPAHRSPKWPFTAAGVFATMPAVPAYALPWLFGGCGSIQILTVVTYWALVRPAAGALEAIWQRYGQLDMCHEAELNDALLFGAAAQRGAAAAASAAGAHFYWTWCLLEIATRRRPLGQRIAAVTGIGLLLLPIPLALVFLGERSLVQAAANAMLGAALGLVFFLTLHASPFWKALQASTPCVKSPQSANTWRAFWFTPRDNLTSFWGGSIWPRTRTNHFPMPHPCAVLGAGPHHHLDDPKCDSGS